MPAGILRETYECSFETYPINDVRGRQTIIQAFVADLIALNIGWVVTSEEIPTSDFTYSSTYYRCWLKYKNSDHLLQIWVQGGSYSSNSKINFSLYEAGSTTSTVTTSGGIGISDSTTGHRMLAIFYYSADWCCVRVKGATSIKWPLPADASNTSGFTAFVVESFINAQVTSEYLNLNASNLFDGSQYGQYGYLTGDDESKYTKPVWCYSDMASEIEKIQKIQIKNTVWQLKAAYNFSNIIGAPVHSILVINGSNYFYYSFIDDDYPQIVRLG